jgi:hypothetical protein
MVSWLFFGGKGVVKMLNYRLFHTIALILSHFFLLIFISDAVGGYCEFEDSGQSLGSSNSDAVALGDVDGDGDLDAFVANNGQNRVWLNTFYCFADIDEDGDVDGQDLAVMASEYGHSNCEIELITKLVNENVALKKEISRLKAQLASKVIDKEKINDSSGRNFQKANIDETTFFSIKKMAINLTEQ